MANRGVVDTVSPEEVCMCASGLEESRYPTVDGVPNVVHKFANARLYKFLGKFYSSLLIHGYLPSSLTVIEGTLILKNA